MQRTAYSEAVREGRDFSVALYDGQARMVAQGDYSPGHLGSMPEVVERILETYPIETLAADDSIILNDPWLGSGHLPDFLLALPVFLDDILVGFAVSCVHMVDVGGAVSGSQAVAGINDVYQEGLRLLPTRLWRRGRCNTEVMRIIEANVRVPEKLRGDLDAMRACNHVAGRELRLLVERVGYDTYERACGAILTQSEQAMRESIHEIPDGRYAAVDHLDDSGPDSKPVRIEAAVVVAGDALEIDFSGSSGRTRSGINSVANYSRAYCFFVVKAVTHGASLPQNAGSIRPIGWRAPEDSVMNVSPPSGVGARAIMQQRIVDVLMQALAEVLPDRVVAPCGHWANPVIGGTDPRTGKPFVFYDIIVGGWGGRLGRDGMEAMCASFNIDGIPAEVNEHSYPVLIECCELIPDSAGPGRWRGGHGIKKDVRVLGEDMHLVNLGDRHRFPPPGIFGGGAGAMAETVINPDFAAEKLHSKAWRQLSGQDVVSQRLSGGGGYGDPLERDPASVAGDVRAGVLTERRAAQVYGVILHEDRRVDQTATTAKRQAARRAPQRLSPTATG